MTCKIYRLYKLSNTLYRWKIPFLPKAIYYFMRLAFATSIPYSATIGKNAYFNNWGMNIVIHPRALIGENCLVGHNVTIGELSQHDEVPVLGDNVGIGVGARIIGPVRIGDYAKIGANAVVIHDVPAHATVVGVPARIIGDPAASL